MYFQGKVYRKRDVEYTDPRIDCAELSCTQIDSAAAQCKSVPDFVHHFGHVSVMQWFCPLHCICLFHTWSARKQVAKKSLLFYFYL